MDLEIICDEGICYMALCNSNNSIMMSGSINNSLYNNIPKNSILLDKYKYKNVITLMNNTLLDDANFIIEIISNNSICLRGFTITATSEYNFVKFKINQDNMFNICQEYLKN